MKFILWDRKDGHRPRLDDDGNVDSDGILGRIGSDNVYLTTYARYPGNMRPNDLEVGAAIRSVSFSLSGSSGSYDIYRVS